MPALLFEKRGHIAYITFNRPEVHNSFNPETLARLSDAWEEVTRNDEIRVAIVSGAGAAAFSAGADLDSLIPLCTGARNPHDEWDNRLLENSLYGDMALLLNYDVDKPIVAAIN